MAKSTPVKQPIEPITPPELPPVTDIVTNAIVPDFDIESAIADQLLDDIDWQRVRAALISKAKQKFISMLLGNGSDRPVVISQYPELHALPSSESDEVKAA